MRFVRDASGASHDCNISGSLSGVRPGESKELKITVPQRPEGEDFRLCPGWWGGVNLPRLDGFLDRSSRLRPMAIP